MKMKSFILKNVFTPLGVLFICLIVCNPTSAKNFNPKPKSSKIMGYEVLLERANKLYRAEKFTQANLLYRKAEKRGLDPQIATMNIGKCFYRVQDFASAAAAFRKGVRLTGYQYSPALFNLAATLYRLGEYGESISIYHQGLALEPDNFGAWLYLAEAYQKTGDITGVQRALEKARELDATDAGVVYQLAEVHVGLKEYEQAILFVREAYAMMPKEVDFMFYIGDLYRVQKKWMDAASIYRQGLAQSGDRVEVLYKLADVLVEDKKPLLAVGYLQKSVVIKPDFIDGWIFLGNLSQDLKWGERAELAYVKAAELGSDEGIQGLRNIAYDLELKKNSERAIEVLKNALILSPGHLEVTEDLKRIQENQ